MTVSALKVTIPALAIVCGCSSAQKASEVSAEYVPTAQYNNHTCAQLSNEAESLRRAIPAMEAAVDEHRSNQTGVEVVTWVLFWPAAFALDKGETQASRLARARGELNAIQAVLMTKDCKSSGGSQTESAGTARSDQSGQIASRLKELENMRRDNLISEDEYRKKRQEILDRM